MAYWGLTFVSYVDIKTTLAFLAVCLFLYNILKQRYNLPPGPIGLPLIGNLPGLVFNLLRSGDCPEHLLAKMARQYGKVFSLKLGTNVVVVANGYHSIKEAFQNPLMNDRPKSKVMEETALDEGHRVCLGKNLAKMELFIFFSHLLHRFTIRTPNEGHTISFKGISGLTYGPEPFDIVAVNRN